MMTRRPGSATPARRRIAPAAADGPVTRFAITPVSPGAPASVTASPTAPAANVARMVAVARADRVRVPRYVLLAGSAIRLRRTVRQIAIAPAVSADLIRSAVLPAARARDPRRAMRRVDAIAPPTAPAVNAARMAAEVLAVRARDPRRAMRRVRVSQARIRVHRAPHVRRVRREVDAAGASRREFAFRVLVPDQQAEPAVTGVGPQATVAPPTAPAVNAARMAAEVLAVRARDPRRAILQEGVNPRCPAETGVAIRAKRALRVRPTAALATDVSLVLQGRVLTRVEQARVSATPVAGGELALFLLAAPRSGSQTQLGFTRRTRQ